MTIKNSTCKGTVKWFDDALGYGFIITPELKEIMVHYTDIHEMDGYKSLDKNSVVKYTPEFIEGKGWRARSVCLVNRNAMDAQVPSLSSFPLTIGEQVNINTGKAGEIILTVTKTGEEGVTLSFLAPKTINIKRRDITQENSPVD